MLNTGSRLLDAKGGGSRQGRPQRNPDATGGGGEGVVVRERESRSHDGSEERKHTPMAKALSLWKDQNRGTRRTRKLYMGEHPWSRRNGKERFRKYDGD